MLNTQSHIPIVEVELYNMSVSAVHCWNLKLKFSCLVCLVGRSMGEKKTKPWNHQFESSLHLTELTAKIICLPTWETGPFLEIVAKNTAEGFAHCDFLLHHSWDCYSSAPGASSLDSYDAPTSVSCTCLTKGIFTIVLLNWCRSRCGHLPGFKKWATLVYLKNSLNGFWFSLNWFAS